MPRTCGILHAVEPVGYFSHAAYSSFFLSVLDLVCRKHHKYVRLRVTDHTWSEVGAGPTQELIILSRMHRRDMARSFDSGVGPLKGTRYG